MNKYLFDNDFSSGSLRWLKRRDKLNFPNEEKLEQLQAEIIAANDPALAYFFAYEFPYKIYKMQKIILDKEDANYAFLFAQNIKNCDIKALQNIVINSAKIKYITKFACFVPGADKKLLEKIILKSKNVKCAHMYLKYVRGADVNKFKKIILTSNKPRYLFELAKHLTNRKDLSKVEDTIIKIQSFTYIRLLAEKIKTANINKLEEAVLASQNEKEIKKFAKYVRKSKIRKFLIL